uniref:HTH psq-type domain-containing protein n=1 Tax=Caenorhabditis tropicalis TaxID=1561998 RepID=A0A1I7T4U4_9PELO
MGFTALNSDEATHAEKRVHVSIIMIPRGETRGLVAAAEDISPRKLRKKIDKRQKSSVVPSNHSTSHGPRKEALL